MALRVADAVGFPGYRVSSEGWAESLQRNGTWKRLKPVVDDRGRRRFAFRRDGKTYKLRAPRVVLEAFIGPCPEGMECCHENGDETDDRLENLRWDTHSANLLDRRRHGTAVCGEMVNSAKLTADDVREMRRIGYPLKPLAKRFNVTETLVSLILRRKAWQHVS